MFKALLGIIIITSIDVNVEDIRQVCIHTYVYVSFNLAHNNNTYRNLAIFVVEHHNKIKYLIVSWFVLNEQHSPKIC